MLGVLKVLLPCVCLAQDALEVLGVQFSGALIAPNFDTFQRQCFAQGVLQF